MTLTITVKFSPEQEAKLRQSIKQQDKQQTQQLLAEAILLEVEELIAHGKMTFKEGHEWEETLDQLINEMAASLPPDRSPLSDYAISRAGIYGEISTGSPRPFTFSS